MQHGEEADGPLNPEAIAIISMSHNMTYSSYDALMQRAKPLIGEYCDMLTKSWNSNALPFSDNEIIGTISDILDNKATVATYCDRHDSRVTWGVEEQRMLEELVQQKNYLSWKYIAEELEKRTGVFRTPSSCEQRWNRVQNPQIHKGRWSNYEDAVLTESMRLTGSFEMALERLGGRTLAYCRRRWMILHGLE